MTLAPTIPTLLSPSVRGVTAAAPVAVTGGAPFALVLAGAKDAAPTLAGRAAAPARPPAAPPTAGLPAFGQADADPGTILPPDADPLPPAAAVARPDAAEPASVPVAVAATDPVDAVPAPKAMSLPARQPGSPVVSPDPSPTILPAARSGDGDAIEKEAADDEDDGDASAPAQTTASDPAVPPPPIAIAAPIVLPLAAVAASAPSPASVAPPAADVIGADATVPTAPAAPNAAPADNPVTPTPATSTPVTSTSASPATLSPLPTSGNGAGPSIPAPSARLSATATPTVVDGPRPAVGGGWSPPAPPLDPGQMPPIAVMPSSWSVASTLRVATRGAAPVEATTIATSTDVELDPKATAQPDATPSAARLPVAPQPFAPLLPATTVVPAAQAFAAAIQAADRQERHAATGAATPATDPLAALGLVQAGTVIAAPAATGQPALDLRHQAWPAQMIDRIEQLRDAADAGSTRIRVVPDALGSIDVSLHRRDDGAVQVSLVADRPATQALIAEARPELARLGEARGLRLADAGTSFGGAGAGAGGGGRDARADQRRPAAPTAPARAPSDDLRDPAEGRVA